MLNSIAALLCLLISLIQHRRHTVKPALRRPVKLERDWRNKKCDVLSMWCHIYYGGDIFVTSDKNFFKKLPPLLEIGVGDILRPCDALARIREHLT
jgi:hypothetical protein